MADKMRLRFAPSPTGEPHVGNIRTAIFDWLLAQRHGGDFIVRIEDTDQKRSVEGTDEVILDALRWLGIEWDEGPDVGGTHAPYKQSERLGLYAAAADKLLRDGFAYKCYCSEELLRERRDAAPKGKGGGCDRNCRDMNEVERAALEAGGDKPVVRFRMPLDGTTSVNDMIRGEVTFENRLVDDFVIMKSDGFPTYHLAHMVDDYHMGITHVLRGEEWLPSAPRHIQMYKAMGWTPPLFAHLPIILAPDRAKLSKRHGATSLLAYREMGYLPQTMVNFLVLIGWSLDDKTEIFTREELAANFSIERISKSGGIFNTEKLDWMNGHYIRELSAEGLADALLEFWGTYPPPEIGDTPPCRDMALKIAPLVQERLKTLRDAAPLVAFLFKDDIEYETGELIQRGMDAESTREGLQAAHSGLAGLAAFTAEGIEELLRGMAKERGVKPGQLFGALRVATTGQRVAPPLFASLEALGRERALELVGKAVERLGV